MSKYKTDSGNAGVIQNQKESKSQKMILQLDELKKYYSRETGLVDRIISSEKPPVKAVDGVSLSVSRGETVGIIGESGCGKSTLAKTIVGLLQPTSGSVKFAGKNVHELGKSNRKRLTRNIQFVFQDPSSTLEPRFTVKEILLEPLQVHEVGAADHQLNKVKEIIKDVGLSVEQLNRYPSELSGGQRQRVGIARSLILNPEILILDEPTSALDVSVKAQVLNLLKDLQEEYDLTYVIISHDISVVNYLSNRIAVMYLGEIIEKGPTENILKNPKHPYTQSLIESVPKIGDFKSKHPDINPNIPSPVNPPEGCRFHTRCPKVIPSDKSNLKPSTWRSIFEYKTDLKSENISRLTVSKMMEQQSGEENEEELIKFLFQYYAITAELNSDTRTSIIDSFTHMLNGDIDKALASMPEDIQSPCTERSPDSIRAGDNHTVCCHLESEEYNMSDQT